MTKFSSIISSHSSGLSANGSPEALPIGEHPAEAKALSHSSTGKARGLLRRRINTRQGISLVEVMVTTLLSVSILAGIYATFIVGERAWRYYADSIMVRQQLRMAMLVLTNELREARGALIVKEEDPPGVRLNFLKPSAGQISYLWNGGGEDANKLIRQDSSGARVIAGNISSVNYVLTGDLIFIDISAASKPNAARPIYLNLKEQVAFRAKTSRFKSKKGRNEKAKQ